MISLKWNLLFLALTLKLRCRPVILLQYITGEPRAEIALLSRTLFSNQIQTDKIAAPIILGAVFYYRRRCWAWYLRKRYGALVLLGVQGKAPPATGRGAVGV